MLNIKLIPKKALVLALSSCMLLPITANSGVDFTLDIPCPDRECFQILIPYPDLINPDLETPRPSRPYPVPNNTAAHHTIPFSVLRDFFNAVILSNNQLDMNQLASSLFRMVQQLESFVRNPDNFQGRNNARYVQQLRGLSEEIEDGRIAGVIINRSVSLNNRVPGLTLIETVFNWLPGNVFIGPRPEHRSDDPGERFEINAEAIVGTEQFNRLRRLNDMMITYVDSPGLVNFDELINLLNEATQNPNVVFRYNEENWVFNDYTQKWRIRTQSPAPEKIINQVQITKNTNNRYCPEIKMSNKLGCVSVMNPVYKNIQLRYLVSLFG